MFFSETIPDSSGVVIGWDRGELELRAVAGAGGEYTHWANSLITLKELKPGVYEIIELQFFYRSFGWCPIVLNGEYAPAGNFWDEEL